MKHQHRFLPRLALRAALALAGILIATPAPAFDPSHDYEVAPGFADFPLRGGANTFGVVIWTNPCVDTDIPLPSLAAGLAAHGWDVIKLSCNPAFLKTWFAAIPKLVGIIDGFAADEALHGYRNVILGGVAEGGGLALEAATKAPVFGVIAFSPNIGQSAYFPADKSAARVISDLGSSNAQRTLLVMPSDDEVLPGIDQGSAARAVMNGRGTPYLLVDSQVHGHIGGYTPQMLPYAACSVWFFAPPAQLRAGEFHCYHDEAATVMQSLNMNPGDARRIWMGYVDQAGQPLVIVEHRTAAGSTVDVGIGNDLRSKVQGRVASGLPAAWSGNALFIRPSPDDTVALQPNAQSSFWSYGHAKRSGGDWTGTLNLVFSK